MILALDAGNTRIKWGLWADGFLAQGSILTAQAARLFDALHAHARPASAIGSNVAGAAVGEQLEQALQPWRLPVHWIESRAEQCGVRSGYRVPAQLGTDRWAALIGAHARGIGDALVVNSGTAVTIDALTAGGHFLGGLILPGVELMGRALAQGTAGLSLRAGVFEPFPRDTADAIHSGALQALCGAVDRMRRALGRESASVNVVLSGGAAHLLAPMIEPAPILAPSLVLEGLVEIARA